MQKARVDVIQLCNRLRVGFILLIWSLLFGCSEPQLVQNEAVELQVDLNGLADLSTDGRSVIEVSRNETTIFTARILKAEQTIKFQGDPNTTYTLTILKDQNRILSTDFTPNNVRASAVNGVWKLGQSAATIFTNARVEDMTEIFLFSGDETYTNTDIRVRVNWGDGSPESTTTFEMMPGGFGTMLSHNYTTTGRYAITLSGDTDKITEIIDYTFYGLQSDHADLRALRSLEGLLLEDSKFSTIDLTRNRMLTSLSLHNDESLETILLPKNNQLKYIHIPGAGMSTQAIDELISSVYKNAARNNLRNGSFILYKNQSQSATEMVGPPSSTSIETLKLLRDNYNWSIRPDPL
jgi:hypothetical protein